MVSKFKVGIKSLLQQVLSEPELYGDLIYKLRKIVSRADFSDQFRFFFFFFGGGGGGLDLVLSVAWSFGVQMVLFATGI